MMTEPRVFRLIKLPKRKPNTVYIGYGDKGAVKYNTIPTKGDIRIPWECTYSYTADEMRYVKHIEGIKDGKPFFMVCMTGFRITDAIKQKLIDDIPPELLK